MRLIIKPAKLCGNFYLQNLNSAPVEDDGVIYLATPTQEVLALEHGSVDGFKWKLPLEGSSMTPPSFVDDILFVALYNGTIYAINAIEGQTLTKFKVEGSIIASPLVLGNTLFVTSLNRTITAIDVDTENVQWQYESQSGFSASPAMAGKAIYVGSHDGGVCALDSASGEPLWTRNFKGTSNSGSAGIG